MRSIRDNIYCFRAPIVACAMLGVAAMAPPVAVAAVTWNEPSFEDAGDLVPTAQRPHGLGALEEITGDISGELADVYLIYVDNPNTFNACTANSCLANTDILLDTRLYLFDDGGKGVVANDDTLTVPDPQHSLLPRVSTDGSGSTVTDVGLYFLAISHKTARPQNCGGPIFDFFFPGEVSGPDGSGGGSGFTEWTGTAGPGGAYEIRLVGAQFAEGACCNGQSCSQTNPLDCTADGGVFQGIGTECVFGQCPAVCCIPVKPGCVIVDLNECTLLNGDYLDGEGTCPKDKDICDGACCVDSTEHDGADCSSTSELECAADEGVFAGLGTVCPELNDEEADRNEHGAYTPTELCDEATGGAAGLSAARSNFGPGFTDAWVTAPNGLTYTEFGLNGGAALPADFFGPGSDPFSGRIDLEGVPLGITGFGRADTLVNRTFDPFDRCDPPSASTVTVPIQIVELSLKSLDPITVTFNGGGTSETWDVIAGLSSVPSPPSELTAVKDHCNGGRYTTRLFVQPKLTFTKVGTTDTVVLDTGNQAQFPPIEFLTPDLEEENAQSWAHDPDPRLGLQVDYSSTFHPGATPKFTACGDLDHDSDTDLQDYDIIVAGFTSYDERADLDKDGVVDQDDYDQWLCCLHCGSSFAQPSCRRIPILPGVVDGVDHDIRKQRFLSINPNNPTDATRMRLSLLDNGCSVTGKQCSDDGSCTVCDAGSANAGEPCDKDSTCSGGSCVVSGETCEEQSPPLVLGFILDPVQAGGDALPNTLIAGVGADPGFRVWDETLVHIVDCEVAPGRVYRVEVEDVGLPGSFSALDMRTSPKPEGKDWGDIVGNFTGTEWTAGNFLVNVDDVSSIIKFLTLKPAPHLTRCEMLSANAPLYVNMNVNASELGQIIRCFQGELFPSLPMTIGGYPDLNGLDGPVETLLDCTGN